MQTPVKWKVTNPDAVTNFSRTPHEKQEFLVFGIAVAGKDSKQTANGLHRLYTSLRNHEVARRVRAGHSRADAITAVRQHSPFELIRTAGSEENLARHAHRAGVTPHTQRARSMWHLAHKYPDHDLSTLSLDDLSSIPGVSHKTARFFLQHTTDGAKHAILDTHVRGWMRDHGSVVPKKGTLNGPQYARFEREYHELADRHVGEGTTCDQCAHAGAPSHADLDLDIWRSRSSAKPKAFKFAGRKFAVDKTWESRMGRRASLAEGDVVPFNRVANKFVTPGADQDAASSKHARPYHNMVPERFKSGVCGQLKLGNLRPLDPSCDVYQNLRKNRSCGDPITHVIHLGDDGASLGVCAGHAELMTRRARMGEGNMPIQGVLPFNASKTESMETRRMMTAVDRITAKLTESRLRLVKTHGEGSHVAKVYSDRDYNEFRVKHFKDGVHQAAADYHTNDAEDAHATAQHWVKARGNMARMGEAFDKDPGSAKPPGWYHPAATPERPQPRTPAPRDLKGVRSAKPRDYHPTPKVAPTHPPASAPRTIKDVRGAKPPGWHHGVTESTSMRCTSCGTASRDYGLRAPVDGKHQPVCIGCHDANFRGKALTSAGPRVANKQGANSFGGAAANAARERGGRMVGDRVMSVPKGSVSESVTMENALLNARRLWPTASHVEPHSSGGFLVLHSGGRAGRTYMDRNGHEMTQEDAEGPQRRIKYEPRKVRGRVMSRPVR